jgi:thiol-disulfide isomerase/thioredoxin
VFFFVKKSQVIALLISVVLLASTSGFAASVGNKRPLGIGDDAWESPGKPLPSLDGNRYAIDHWNGKVVLINFWASWCSPCQYEIPELVKLQQRYGSDGFQVIGIGIDREKPLRNVSRSLGINYPVLVAKNPYGADLLSRWGNRMQIVPYNVVVDREGKISYTLQGQVDQEIFAEYILPLLKAPETHTQTN